MISRETPYFGRLEQVKLTNTHIENSHQDSNEIAFFRSYVLLITYGAFEKDIEDIFLFNFKSNSVFSNIYFDKNQLHRGLYYADLKHFIKSYFKVIVLPKDSQKFNMTFLTPEKQKQFNDLLHLRHDIAHQNNSAMILSKEQVNDFLELCIHLRDEIYIYLNKIYAYSINLLVE